MSSIRRVRLAELLRDLGPEFSALSDEGRSALCESINEQFTVFHTLREHLRDVTPHKRMGRWQQIERATEKVQELLHGFTFEMMGEIDRMRGHRRGAMEQPTRVEVLEEMSTNPAVPKDKFEVPSEAALKEVYRIEESLSSIVAIAQSDINYNSNQKNSKRKYDEVHLMFIGTLAGLYERTCQTKASARREGRWIVFLARILSILDGKKTSTDAAYESWCKVKKELA